MNKCICCSHPDSLGVHYSRFLSVARLPILTTRITEVTRRAQCLPFSLPSLTLTRGESGSGRAGEETADPMETPSARGAGRDGDCVSRPCNSIPCPPYRNSYRGRLKVSVEEADWAGAPSLAFFCHY